MARRPGSFTVDPSGQIVDEFGNVIFEAVEQAGSKRNALILAALGASAYRYNPAAHRYIASNGRFVPDSMVRAELDKALQASQKRMRTYSNKLRDGKMTVAEWQTGMMQEIKSTHLNSAALSKGGWGQMTQADYGRVGQQIRTQYDYLRNFANQIASGEQRLDGVFLRRADMYFEAGRGTYHEFERREMAIRGFDEEANILEPTARHCNGCLEQTARGWVPVGSLIRIGARACLTRCRCRIQYRNTSTNEVRK